MRTLTPTERHSPAPASAGSRGPLANAATMAVTGRKLLEQICACPSLPSLPTVVVEVLQLTGRPDADLPQVSRAVAKDPALVARVLRTANSSYYGLRHRVVSVAQALPVLGVKNLRVLVAGHSVFPALKRCGPAGARQVDCCRRSLYSATAGRLLAERLGVASPDECFLAALLMDIGVLAAAVALGPPYAELLDAVERHGDLERLEQERLGLSHPIVAAVLARQWKLPDSLSVPIQFHHAPQLAGGGPHETSARVIRLAGFCADIFLEHNPLWPLAEAYRLAAEEFGAEKAAVDAVLEELATETRRLGAAFDVEVDEGATFARAHGRVADELRSALTEVSEAPAEAGADGRHETGAAAASTGDERRHERRAPHEGTVAVFPCTDSTVRRPVRASLCDVSPSGIGLRFEEPLDVGSRFILGLRRAGRKTTVVLYQVRHCGPAESDGGDREHAVGAELVRVLRERDLLHDASADSPLHRVGRLLLRGEPSVAVVPDGPSGEARRPNDDPEAPSAAAAGGLDDPGPSCC